MADRVSFTGDSAARIAKAVRVVEAGDRGTQPLEFEPYHAPRRLRVGTFAGNWGTGEYKTVTLSGSTQTVSVYNWTTPAVGTPEDTSCSRVVVFGRVKDRNAALDIQLRPTCASCVMSFGSIDLTTISGYDGTKIQLLGHDNSACLHWYSIATCATAS